MKRGGARSNDDEGVAAADKAVDFKQKWRVQRAVRALKKKYGLKGLRARLALFFFGTIGTLVVVLLEVGVPWHSDTSHALSIIKH